MAKKAVVKNGLARKEFQKAISNLKKSGLVPKKVDVRKVQQTKHYSGLIRKFKDIAEGSAIATPIPDRKLVATFNERGDDVIQYGKKVFLKGNLEVNKKGEITNPYTLKVNKKGEVIRRYRKTTPDGRTVYVTQKELPIKYENIEQWLSDLSSQDYRLASGEKIIFKLYGNYSRQAYSSFDQAFKKFMTYDVVVKALDGNLDPVHEAELVRSVAFEKVTGSKAKTYNRDRIVNLDKQFSKQDKKSYLRSMIIFPKKPKGA